MKIEFESRQREILFYMNQAEGSEQGTAILASAVGMTLTANVAIVNDFLTDEDGNLLTDEADNYLRWSA